MKLTQLIARLSAMHANRKLPIQIYDFTDIFQITEIALDESLNIYQLVADSQTRKIPVGEFIDTLSRLLDINCDKDVETLLPDGTLHTLDKVEFDQRKQTYVITLGTKISEKTSKENIFVSFNDWKPLV